MRIFFRNSVIVICLGLLAGLSSCGSKTVGKTASKGDSSKETNSKAEYLFVKGVGEFLQQDYSSAIRLFEEALNLSPKNAAIHYKMGESYFLMRSPSKAIDHLKKAIELDPKQQTYRLLLAEVYLTQQEFAKSAEVYKNLVEDIESAYPYYGELGDLYYDMGQREIAKKAVYANSGINNAKRDKEIKENSQRYFHMAIDAYNNYEKKEGVSEELIRVKQRLYLLMNDVDNAILEGEELVKAQPKNVMFRISQSDLYYQNDRNQEGIDYLLKVVDEFPKDPKPRLVLSDYYRGMGEKEKSEEQLKAAFNNPHMNLDAKVKLISEYLHQANISKNQLGLQLAEETVAGHPESAKAYSLLGDARYVNSDLEGAREAYYKAVTIDEKKYLIWEQIVVIDNRLSKHDRALESVNEALDVFPSKPLLWMYKGSSHMLKKQDSLAVVSLEEGRKHAGDEAMLSQFDAQLGDAYNEAELFEKSDKAYENALEFDPNNPHVLNNYSYFLSLRKDKLNQARSMSERLIRMHPAEATYLDTYAWVLYQLEEFKLAKKYLLKALETSSDGTIIEHYGDVLFKMDQVDDAVEQWKKAKTSGGATDLIDKKIADKQLYEE